MEFDQAARRWQLDRISMITDRGLGIDDAENFRSRLDGTLENNVQPAQGFDRIVKEKNARVQSDKTCGRKIRRNKRRGAPGQRRAAAMVSTSGPVISVERTIRIMFTNWSQLLCWKDFSW